MADNAVPNEAAEFTAAVLEQWPNVLNMIDDDDGERWSPRSIRELLVDLNKLPTAAERVLRVNQRVHNECTMLGFAIFHNDVALMHELVRAGADLTATYVPPPRFFDDNGEPDNDEALPPVICAVRSDCIASLGALVDLFGLALDVVDHHGRSALVHAALCHSEAAFGFLVARLPLQGRFAALNARNTDGATLVELALRGHPDFEYDTPSFDIFATLMSIAPHLIDVAMQRSSFGFALCRIPYPIASVFLSQMLQVGTFCVHGVDDNGLSALELAAEAGAVASVRALLLAGAEVHSHTVEAAMRVGSSSDLLDVLLLGFGRVSPSMLMRAAGGRDAHLMRRLLMAFDGCAAHQVNADGNTMLHVAIDVTVQSLLLPICDVKAKNAGGLTPLAVLALSYSNSGEEQIRLMQNLLRAGASVTEVSFAGIARVCARNLGALRLLQDHGLTTLPLDSQRRSVLHQVAQMQSVRNESCRWLIKHNRQLVDAVDNKGMTPLHFAVQESSQLDLVELLLKWCTPATLNRRSASGLTPLMLAIKNNNAGAVSLLLKHGADVRTHTNTSLAEMALSSSVEVLVALAAHGVAFPAHGIVVQERPRLFCFLVMAGVITETPVVRDIDVLLLSRAFDLPCSPIVATALQAVVQEQPEALRAARQIAKQSSDLIVDHALDAILPRAVDVLIALQPLGLPALVSLHIIDELMPLAHVVTDALKWQVITLVKHFAEPRCFECSQLLLPDSPVCMCGYMLCDAHTSTCASCTNLTCAHCKRHCVRCERQFCWTCTAICYETRDELDFCLDCFWQEKKPPMLT